MVSSETLLSHSYWKIPFIVHTDVSAKKLGAVISQKKNQLPYY